MKSILLALVLMGALCVPATGQSKIKGPDSYYFTVEMRRTRIDGSSASFIGAGGGGLFNVAKKQQIGAGIRGYWLTNVSSIRARALANGFKYRDLSYWMGETFYRVQPHSIITLKAGVMAGPGVLRYRANDVKEFDGGLVIEPIGTITLNVAGFNFGVGASYRLWNGLDNGFIENEDLTGWQTHLIFRAGG